VTISTQQTEFLPEVRKIFFAGMGVLYLVPDCSLDGVFSILDCSLDGFGKRNKK
jgi:hypothetical protein